MTENELQTALAMLIDAHGLPWVVKTLQVAQLKRQRGEAKNSLPSDTKLNKALRALDSEALSRLAKALKNPL